MKKLVVFILTIFLSLSAFANVVNSKERKELRKEFKLYKTENENNRFLMKNSVGKREIIIAKNLHNLPKTSEIAFGDKAWKDNDQWETRKNKNNIQYFGIPHTSKRKALKVIDGKYVLFFYPAIGNNDDMVEDTMERIEEILKKY